MQSGTFREKKIAGTARRSQQLNRKNTDELLYNLSDSAAYLQRGRPRGRQYAAGIIAERSGSDGVFIRKKIVLWGLS